jgi:hypothetical protein
MLKRKLIIGASLIVILVSMFGMLKTIFDVPPVQSTRTTTVAAAATSTPNILPVSAPRIEPIPEPTQSTPATTVVSTATSTPGILPVSTIPRPEATPTSAQSTPTTTVDPTPTPKLLKRRVVKHQPDQFRKGAISKDELSAIKTAMKTIPWSRNSDPKAAADEDYAAIVKECEKSSKHGLLTDLVTEAVSNDYESNNEAANAAYFTELNSDFENGVKTDRKNQKAQ